MNLGADHWPERVDFPGESRRHNGHVDRNEYYLAVFRPMHYPNGPSLPLSGPTPKDHPVVMAASRMDPCAIRVHRDRFIAARRFLHDGIESGQVEAVRHWKYESFCEMDREGFARLLDLLEIDLDNVRGRTDAAQSVCEGTPRADAVAERIKEYVADLEERRNLKIRVLLHYTTTDANPYLDSVLFDEEALMHFTEERYVPPLPYRLNGMWV